MFRPSRVLLYFLFEFTGLLSFFPSTSIEVFVVVTCKGQQPAPHGTRPPGPRGRWGRLCFSFGCEPGHEPGRLPDTGRNVSETLTR
jgi:hypothetical protein